MGYVANAAPAGRKAPRGASRFGHELRVTFFGDSIFRGQQDTGVDDPDGGVRGPLYRLMRTRREVRFAGSQNTGTAPYSHEAYSGIGIAAVAAGLVAKLASAAPDLAIWYLGTNEIGSGDTPANDAAAYNTGLITPTLAYSATIKALILPLFFFNSSPDTSDPERRAFNAALEPLVRANSAFGTRLFWGGSVARALKDPADFYAAGNVHPSSGVGFTKFADAIWYELTSQGLI